MKKIIHIKIIRSEIVRMKGRKIKRKLKNTDIIS